MHKFLATFLELKAQTFQKLSTSVEEEKSKEDWFLEISAREEKASQTLRQLQKEIKAEKAERERQARPCCVPFPSTACARAPALMWHATASARSLLQVSARNETIQKLREELEEIKTGTINEIKALEADTTAQEEADKTGFQSKEAALKEELTKLTAELAQRKDENRESEELHRKKKVKNESEVENWLSKCADAIAEGGAGVAVDCHDHRLAGMIRTWTKRTRRSQRSGWSTTKRRRPPTPRPKLSRSHWRDCLGLTFQRPCIPMFLSMAGADAVGGLF